MKAAFNRFAQGISALLAFAKTPDLNVTRRHLTSCEFKAFLSMSRSEQLHSLKVLGKVQAKYPDAPKDLIAAALLHDVGKSRYRLSLCQRTLAVLLEAIAPHASRRLSQAETLSSWRAPFVVRRHHAQWGGEMLRDCGSNVDVVWLVERHQDNAEVYRGDRRYGLLASLQEADAEC